MTDANSEATARLNAIAECLIVDPTPVDAYGRFELTYGDLRVLRTRIRELERVLREVRRALDPEDDPTRLPYAALRGQVQNALASSDRL